MYGSFGLTCICRILRKALQRVREDFRGFCRESPAEGADVVSVGPISDVPTPQTKRSH